MVFALRSRVDSTEAACTNAFRTWHDGSLLWSADAIDKGSVAEDRRAGDCLTGVRAVALANDRHFNEPWRGRARKDAFQGLAQRAACHLSLLDDDHDPRPSRAFRARDYCDTVPYSGTYNVQTVSVSLFREIQVYLSNRPPPLRVRVRVRAAAAAEVVA